MSVGGGRVSDQQDPMLELTPEELLQGLEQHERVLLEVKIKLYEGSWEQMLIDLRARLDGKPYIYKLSKTITRDISAIERLMAYESRRGVDLADLMSRQHS